MDPGSGARNSYEDEILQHARTLYGWALALSRAPADAQDLVQETLERALRSFDRYAPGTNARSWLHRIMFNLFVDHRRRAAHEIITDPEHLADVPAPSPEATPLWHDVTMDEVQGALVRLDPRFRVALERWLFAETSYRELSTDLGIPEATVGTRLLRGREKLRAVLLEGRA